MPPETALHVLQRSITWHEPSDMTTKCALRRQLYNALRDGATCSAPQNCKLVLQPRSVDKHGSQHVVRLWLDPLGDRLSVRPCSTGEGWQARGGWGASGCQHTEAGRPRVVCGVHVPHAPYRRASQARRALACIGSPAGTAPSGWSRWTPRSGEGRCGAVTSEHESPASGHAAGLLRPGARRGGVHECLSRRRSAVRLHTVGLVAMLAFALLMAPRTVAAQQRGTIPRIGILVTGRPATSPSSRACYVFFLQGLHDLGYVEGHNIRFEYRSCIAPAISGA